MTQDVSFCTARPAQTAARLVVVSGDALQQSRAPRAASDGAASRPAVLRDASPWSPEEDELLVQLCARKGRNDSAAPAYDAVAAKTGRSVNAVKVRFYVVLRSGWATEVFGACSVAG